MMDDEAYAGGDIIILSPKNKNNYFYGYVLNNDLVNKQTRIKGQGQSVVHIYSKDLESVKIPKPFNHEENKIAEILFTWDKAIELKEKLIEEKNEFKRGMMQKLLTGKIRFPDFTGDWEKAKISKLLGESCVLSKEPDLKRQISVKLYLNGVSLRKLKGNEVDGATTLYVRKAGQFIYGKQNFHNGAFGIIPKQLDNCQTSSDIPTFDFKDKINPMYFFYYWSQKNKYLNLEAFTTGTGSKRLDPKIFLKMYMIIPNINEENKIVGFIRSVDNEIELLNKELNQLKEQKRGLMQLLLTGIVRVEVD